MLNGFDSDEAVSPGQSPNPETLPSASPQRAAQEESAAAAAAAAAPSPQASQSSLMAETEAQFAWLVEAYGQERVRKARQFCDDDMNRTVAFLIDSDDNRASMAATPAAAAAGTGDSDDDDEMQRPPARAEPPVESEAPPAKRKSVGHAAASGKRPAVHTSKVGDWVESCFYHREVGGEPRVHKPPWYSAEVRAVNADEGTVDVLYALDSTAVLHVPIKHVRPAQRPADDVNPLHEMALIEKVRAMTMARNREVMKQLRLVPIDMRTQRPKAKRRKATSSVPLAPRQQPVRGRAPDPLQEYQLGFDFGYANSLMGYQSNDIFDVLVAAYDEKVANQIVDRYLVEGGDDGGSSDGAGCAGSSSSGASTGGSGAASGGDISIVVFARLGVRVVGAALLRVHASTTLGTRIFEVAFVAVVQRGLAIGEALVAWIQLLAARWGVMDIPPLLVTWGNGCTVDAALAADDEQTLRDSWSTLRFDLAEMGHALSAPPHLSGCRLMQLEPPDWRDAMKKLRLQRARSVQQLVAANEAASQAAKASATALLQGADAAAAEHDAAAAEHDVSVLPFDAYGKLELPHAPACGSYVALWYGIDAMFTFAHINSFTEKLFDVSRTASGRAGATQRGRQEVDVSVDVTPFKWDDKRGELEEDSIADPLHAHELLESSSVAWASDREATLRSGMAIDLHGDSLKVCRPYHVIAALPDSPAFARQIMEVLAAIKSPIDYGPELPTYYFGGRGKNGEWPTDPAILLERAVKMADKFRGRPPSARDEWPSPRKMGDPSSAEPKGFRCSTWEEVRRRCGTLDIRCQEDSKGANRTSNGKEVAEPCTRPRTLELYCGRASLSAHHQRRGAHAWFVDWDRTVVEPSFNSTPEYFPLDDPHGNGGRVHCINGLEHRRFIHLDFLDFAMAVLLGEVNLGELHAIHDGFDCTTMTMMATSEHERHTSNFFAGTSEKAFITNVRHHFLVAVHLQLQMCGQTTHCCRTAENPADAGRRQFHPLTRNVLEKPKRDGGLGMVKSWLSYCQLLAGFQKHTNIWSDLVQVHEEFYSPGSQGEGIMKRFCCKEQPCNLFLSHRQVRPRKGDAGRIDRGSIYPDELCQLLTGAMARLFGVVRTLKLDAANTDGWEDACAKCGNNGSRTKGTFHDCWKCEFCPQIYCFKCIPSELRPTQCDICKAQRKAQEQGKEYDDTRCPCPPWKCPECVGGH